IFGKRWRSSASRCLVSRPENSFHRAAAAGPSFASTAVRRRIHISSTLRWSATKRSRMALGGVALGIFETISCSRLVPAREYVRPIRQALVQVPRVPRYPAFAADRVPLLRPFRLPRQRDHARRGRAPLISANGKALHIDGIVESARLSTPQRRNT